MKIASEVRAPALAIFGALMLALIGAFVLLGLRANGPGSQGFDGSVVLHHAGGIELTDDTGEPIAIGSSPNRTIVVLGFTRCTEQCPLTLARVAVALGEAPSRNRPRAFFVTVDPAHDDPLTLHRYLRAWSNSITGITGTRVALRRFYLSLGSVDLGSHYRDHDSRIFVLNSDGDVEQNLSAESSADEIRRALLG